LVACSDSQLLELGVLGLIRDLHDHWASGQGSYCGSSTTHNGQTHGVGPPCSADDSHSMGPGSPHCATDFTVSGSCSVKLSWNDISCEDGYRIYRDGSFLAYRPANSTSYTDVINDPNSTADAWVGHSYYVQAYNAAGVANSNQGTSGPCYWVH